MSNAEKLRRTLWYALSSPDLSSEIKKALEELLNPNNLAIAAGVLAIWAASHFFGIGEVADKPSQQLTGGGEKLWQVSSSGLRNEQPLSPEQVAEAKDYAKKLGMPVDDIYYSENMNTPYANVFGQERLYIGDATERLKNAGKTLSDAELFLEQR